MRRAGDGGGLGRRRSGRRGLIRCGLLSARLLANELLEIGQRRGVTRRRQRVDVLVGVAGVRLGVERRARDGLVARILERLPLRRGGFLLGLDGGAEVDKVVVEARRLRVEQRRRDGQGVVLRVLLFGVGGEGVERRKLGRRRVVVCTTEAPVVIVRSVAVEQLRRIVEATSSDADQCSLLSGRLRRRLRQVVVRQRPGKAGQYRLRLLRRGGEGLVDVLCRGERVSSVKRGE